MRVGLYGGIVVALPVILWQLWRFIVPALNQKEKKWAIPIIVISSTLFVAGGALAYFTIGQALDFLIGWSGRGRRPGVLGAELRVADRIDDLRLRARVHAAGVRLRRSRPSAWSHPAVAGSWRIALVVIAVIAAVITPSGDPVTMAMLGVPMVVLYFLAILLGWLVVRRRPVDA